jgi:hypothetical protein
LDAELFTPDALEQDTVVMSCACPWCPFLEKTHGDLVALSNLDQSTA